MTHDIHAITHEHLASCTAFPLTLTVGPLRPPAMSPAPTSATTGRTLPGQSQSRQKLDCHGSQCLSSTCQMLCALQRPANMLGNDPHMHAPLQHFPFSYLSAHIRQCLERMAWGAGAEAVQGQQDCGCQVPHRAGPVGLPPPGDLVLPDQPG